MLSTGTHLATHLVLAVLRPLVVVLVIQVVLVLVLVIWIRHLRRQATNVKAKCAYMHTLQHIVDVLGH